jgi:hypothetical protein
MEYIAGEVSTACQWQARLFGGFAVKISDAGNKKVPLRAGTFEYLSDSHIAFRGA